MSIVTLPLNPMGHFFVQEKDTMDILVFDGEKRVLSGWGTCGNCGEFHTDFDITDTEVRAKTKCPQPDGVTTVIDLEVPSGKIVITDDLRGVYPIKDRDDFASYNSALGQAQVVWAMAKIGCAYGPVGNSCPGLYRTGDDTYVIATGCYGDDGELLPEVSSWERLASVCTDLWAYSIADYGDFLSKVGDDLSSWDGVIDVVEVPAGTYRFTHHTGEKDFDPWADGTVIFTHIEYLGNDSDDW